MSSYQERKTVDGEKYYLDPTTGLYACELPEGAVDDQSGVWCWVEDAAEGWVPAKASGDGRVQVGGSGDLVSLGERKTLPLKRAILDKPVTDDLVMLDDVNEGAILHTLRARHTAPGSGFYTSAGTILIALNPYTYHPIYTTEHIRKYLRPGNQRLAPHVFQVAAAAHTALTLEGRNQAILISGESGAGKTEAMKHCLAFMAEVAGSDSAVETQVLQANPLLESFGNAKTVRNHNSSRFGRWIEIHFDESGAIASARIEQYLLEKSRVVHQASSERSYHVFYMLCESPAGESLGLGHPSSYRFLRHSGSYDVEGRDERHEYRIVTNAMEVLGFPEEEVGEIFAFLAALLLAGNLTFKATGGADEPGCEIADADAAARVAALWKVAETTLHKSFTSHSIEVRGEALAAELRPAEALDAAAAAAKHVYGALFGYICKRVNELLDGPRGQHVGVLDIFGFEIFAVNSFEQLCINYANEKLQQLFCVHVFQKEEQLYREEQVKHDHVAFIDNQPVLTLIEARPKGILAVLDDEAFIGPKGSDEGFVRNVATMHGKDPLLHVFTYTEERKGHPKGFSLQHYAGAVAYDVRGFLEKNKDPVSPDLITLLQASTSTVGKRLFVEEARGEARGHAGPGRARGMTASRRVTLGGQFRAQLHQLVDMLNETDPHFIRCIKPNASKQPRGFDAPMALSQLRFAGVFEAVAIRKSGFPFRMTLQRFCHWFKCLLLPRTAAGYTQTRTFSLAAWESPNQQHQARQILAHTGQRFDKVQIGRSLVLYRAEDHRLLELLRNLALSVLVPYLQRLVRGFLARECRRRCLRSAASLRVALESACSVGECDAAASQHGKTIGSYARLFSARVKEIRELRKLRTAFEEWLRVERELEAALAKYVITQGGDDEEEAAFGGVETALAHAEKLRAAVGPKCTPFQQKIYEHARKIVDANAAARLTPMAEEALWLLDKSKMEYVRDEAKRVGFVNAEIGEISAHLSLPEEKLVEMQLKRAVELQDPRRVQNREMRLRDLYVCKFSRLYETTAYPRLRSPMEWAEAKTGKTGKLGKALASRGATESRAANMLEHSAKPIHISLTDIDSALHNKEAVSLFKSALAWAGERPDPTPAFHAHTILKAARDTPELRPELYLQMLKQLTNCEVAEAARRYWELLALLLQVAAPGTGCEDFVHAYCYKHAAADTSKRLISQIHRGRYNEDMLSALPAAEDLPAIARAFLAFKSNSSSRFDAADLITSISLQQGGARLSAASPSVRHRAPTMTSLRPIPKMDERTPDVS